MLESCLPIQHDAKHDMTDSYTQIMCSGVRLFLQIFTSIRLKLGESALKYPAPSIHESNGTNVKEKTISVTMK